MNLKKIVTTVTDLAVGVGVGTVLTNAVKATTPTGMKPYMKVFVFVGSAALSGLVGSAASDYTVKQIDDISDSFKEIKENLNNSND